MNTQERIAEGRKHLGEAVDSAPDEVMDRMIQSINLGHTVLDMFEALAKTRERMPEILKSEAAPPDATEDNITMGAKCIMTNKQTGDAIAINVSFATAEEIEAYKQEMEEAKILPDE